MKWILQILLMLLVVATTAICITKPNLHKNVIVYDSAYSLVPSEEVKTETKDIPIMEMPSKPVSVTISSEQKTNPVVKEVNSATVRKQMTTSPKVVQQKTEQKSKTK